MEIRTLRYFLAIAREENMTKAAEILHVTQPTLSKTLRALEDELGKKLFTRHSFSISLTEEGILLRKRAEDLVSMADKIIGEFVSLDDITGGDIYLGLAESYQIRYLAQEIKRFKEVYPGLSYHISSGDTEQSPKSWTRVFSTLPCLRRNRTQQSITISPSRRRIYGALSYLWITLWQKRRASLWMTLPGCHCFARNKGGIATSHAGPEKRWTSCIWKAPFVCPITHPCLSGRVWGFC